MHIIHITSELAPIAKVGGLADVVYGLSKELCRLDHQVEIILPKYDCLHYSQLKSLKVERREVWSFEGVESYNNTIWSAELENLKVILIEPHHPSFFFARGMIYGCPDDVDRFTYFSRVAMEYLFKAGKQPDVIHVHDWPTAIVPVLYKEMYSALKYKVGGTVLTIHNMEHQGKCQPFNLTRIGLEGANYLSSEKMLDPFLPGHLNLLKGGIEYADQITTVSPNYVQEIKTPQGGFGLESTLIKNEKKLHGILNGIDENFWNPADDAFLVEKYNTHQVKTIDELTGVLKGKAENRCQLRTHLGLESCDRPIVASVTRLVPQKGTELIKNALFRTLEKQGQFILLGSSQIPEIHRAFEDLQTQFKDHPHVAILMDKDEALAHQIYAAADMLIIPSLFEPCGLTQMISLRYATVPIVRRTGGLADTVFDVDTSSKPLSERNGFTFDFPDAQGVNWALDRALDCYRNDIQKWKIIMLNGIKMDFTWKKEALAYLKIYQGLQEKKV